MRRICVMTAGHLSTCPRMLKAADALHAHGYEVRMISTNYVPWAAAADQELRRTRDWPWRCVEFDRKTAPCTYFRTGVRFKLFKKWARRAGTANLALPTAARAFSRVHSELVAAACQAPTPDFIYGGTTGALAAVASAAARLGVPFGLDLEDFHSEEQAPGPEASLAHALAHRVQSLILPKAAFLTGGSDGISERYSSEYGVHVTPIHNTFPLPSTPPNVEPSVDGALRVYWFGQTIGAGRGLEESVRALGLSGIRADLSVRGRPVSGYWDVLRQLAATEAPKVRMHLLEPDAPDKMIDLARNHDVGLAIELGKVLNQRILTSNKAFTYMLAGLAIIFSDTPGQRVLESDLGAGGRFHPAEDLAGIAGTFRQWAENPQALLESRRASWHAGASRWHWEHPEERGRLLKLFGDQFPGN